MGHARVVIIGGGVIGSSLAYHLRCREGAGEVIVIERDPSYRRASSSLAMGGVRQQFSLHATVQLAQQSVDFYRRADRVLPRPADNPAIRFRQRGYLFLVDKTGSAAFEARLARQRHAGAVVTRMSSESIRRCFPDIVLDDITFGVFGPQDGYLEPRAVLSGFCEAAARAGVSYVHDTVTGIQQSRGVVQGVTLSGGDTIASTVIVDAAGPQAGHIGDLASVEVPVVPVRQQLFRCALPRPWPYRFPVVVDPTGVHWRHEDPDDRDEPDRIIVARTKPDELPGENFVCDTPRWQKEFLPPLLRRVPGFDGLRVIEGWAGLYEMTPDHNPLLGEHPDLAGFFLATGFSGHGLMLAPAVGAVMAELILNGTTHAIDLSPFDVSRFRYSTPPVDDATI